MNFKWIFLLLFICSSGVCFAQININVPQAQITSGTPLQVDFTAGLYSAALSLTPTFTVASVNGSFALASDATKTLPLSLANIKLVSVGSISLLSSSNEVTLSQQAGTLASSLLSLSSGTVTATLRLVTANNAWLAGTYRTSVQFRATGLLTGNLFSPATQDFNLIVPAFLTVAPNIPTTTLTVNSLDYFRQTPLAPALMAVNVANSVPYNASIRSDAQKFTFSTSSPVNQPPIIDVNNLQFTLAGLPNPTTRSLTISDQTLSTSETPVPVGNNSTYSGQYSISAANLKQNFLQAGTYSVPLSFTWAKPLATAPAGALQQISTTAVNVVVNDMAELVATQANVTLNVSGTAGFKNGVAVDVPAHLRLSKTTPYNLFVRATTSSLSSGTNSIPLEVIEIGPMAGQTGMNTITLSTTAQQLINNANPVIDRDLSIRYRIPPGQTSKLLGKPAGNYRTDIIYSFVAP